MKKYNVIAVFSENKQQILFCKRMKNPYKGLYNFVGGRVEKYENSYDAAYRELYEETGITREDIELSKLIDFTFYHSNFIVESFAGRLKKNVNLVEELHPLEWHSRNDDFTNLDKYAGQGSIQLMYEQIMHYADEILK